MRNVILLIGVLGLVFGMDDLHAQQPAAAFSVITNGQVTKIMLTTGGSDYTIPPTIHIVGGGGSGAVATALVTNGVVTQIILHNFGENYTHAPDVILTPPFDFATGLMGWWRGELNTEDELKQNPARWIARSNYLDGMVGKCFYMAGGWLSLGTNDMFDFHQGAEDFSIETWILPGSQPHTQYLGIVTKTTGLKGWAFYITLQRPIGFCFANVGSWELYAPLPESHDPFYHLAMTKKGNRYSLYLDGELVNTLTTNSFSVADTDVKFGEMFIGEFPLLGNIDETAIYRRALTDREIKAIFDLKEQGKYTPPIITAQPKNTVAYLGGSNELAVAAVGTGTLRYQWMKNGVPINGATNTTLLFNNSQLDHQGAYTVQIHNLLGIVTSPPAQLTVQAARLTLGLTPKLMVEGVPGKTYAIQATTNLDAPVQWQTLTNVTLAQSVEVWYDYATDTTQPEQPKRYYQVIAAP